MFDLIDFSLHFPQSSRNVDAQSSSVYDRISEEQIHEIPRVDIETNSRMIIQSHKDYVENSNEGKTMEERGVYYISKNFKMVS